MSEFTVKYILLMLICLFTFDSIQSFKTFFFTKHQSSTLLSLAGDESSNNKKWDGTRPPIVNMEIIDQKMDAAWGRAKFRTEVWEDDVNPVNDWWTAYEPSDEEVDAASHGYDFKNPEDWFKSKGLDYEKACLAAKIETDARYAEHVKKMEAKQKEFSAEEFLELQDKFFDMQRKAFEIAFRFEDNEKQKLKGQPSLDIEDTGKQWKNDKLE